MLPNDSLDPSPPSCGPLDPQADLIILPLYPARDGNGDLVWESSAELDPLVVFSLLAGCQRLTLKWAWRTQVKTAILLLLARRQPRCQR